MNYLETIKNITKNKEKRVENLVFLVILLVVLLVAANYIFTNKNKEKGEDETKSLISTSNGSNKDKTKDSVENENISNLQGTSKLEEKLATILSEISGVSDVSVVLTYSQDTKQNPIYNTKEQEKQGEKTTEKSVAYNEKSGTKTAIIETVELPKVEGAIVVAKGATSVDIRSKIASAISTVTSVPVYKVQVFEKR
ncbi:MAG: hypothetical protein RSE00_01080 [Clostridia bacterium]